MMTRFSTYAGCGVPHTPPEWLHQRINLWRVRRGTSAGPRDTPFSLHTHLPRELGACVAVQALSKEEYDGGEGLGMCGQEGLRDYCLEVALQGSPPSF